MRGDICALSSSDDVLAPLAVCGSSSKAFCAWLTSQLAEIVYPSKMQLIWRSWRMPVLNALKLLACFVKQFGGSINFTGGDLAQGQLSD